MGESTTRSRVCLEVFSFLLFSEYIALSILFRRHTGGLIQSAKGHTNIYSKLGIGEVKTHNGEKEVTRVHPASRAMMLVSSSPATKDRSASASMRCVIS